jgi:hypothetical protein
LERVRRVRVIFGNSTEQRGLTSNTQLEVMGEKL